MRPQRSETIALPAGDYVSQGLWVFRPDAAFPHMRLGDPSCTAWPYMRRDVSHNWYVDERAPSVGFVNRDEASILYNSGRLFVGARCLEIGCWRGWSTAHLAAGAGSLEVMDPVLADPDWRADVESSLTRAGLRERVELHALASPGGVAELARQNARAWSLIFIDGDHEGEAPRRDAKAAIAHAASDAMILLHDLMAPGPADALAYMRSRGWNTRVFQTSQIMGVAWRGTVEPVPHRPDPSQRWSLPEHLHSFEVSGEEPAQQAERFARVFAQSAVRRRKRKAAASSAALVAAPSTPDDVVLHLRLNQVGFESQVGMGLEGLWSFLVDRFELLIREREASDAELAELTTRSSLERQALHNSVAGLDADLARVQQELAQARAALDAQARREQSLQEEAEKSLLALSEAETTLRAFAQNDVALREEIARVGEKLRAQQEQSAEQLAARVEADARARSFEDRLWEADSRIAQQAAEHVDLERERERIQAALEEQERGRERLERRVQELDDETRNARGVLSDRQSALESASAMLESANASREQLERNVARLSTETMELAERLEARDGDLSDLKQALASAVRECTDLEARLTTATSTCSRLEEEARNAEGERLRSLGELASLQHEATSAGVKLGESQVEIALLKSDCDSLSEKVESITRDSAVEVTWLKDRLLETEEGQSRLRADLGRTSQAWAQADAERGALQSASELAGLAVNRLKEEVNSAALRAADVQADARRRLLPSAAELPDAADRPSEIAENSESVELTFIEAPVPAPKDPESPASDTAD